MRGLAYVVALFFIVIAVGPMLKAWLRRVPLSSRPAQRDELVKDPVCQTYILRSRAVRMEADGVIGHFCSRECAARFSRGERRR
jgi:YHS domain-containing protein